MRWDRNWALLVFFFGWTLGLGLKLRNFLIFIFRELAAPEKVCEERFYSLFNLWFETKDRWMGFEKSDNWKCFSQKVSEFSKRCWLTSLSWSLKGNFSLRKNFPKILEKNFGNFGWIQKFLYKSFWILIFLQKYLYTFFWILENSAIFVTENLNRALNLNVQKI